VAILFSSSCRLKLDHYRYFFLLFDSVTTKLREKWGINNTILDKTRGQACRGQSSKITAPGLRLRVKLCMKFLVILAKNNELEDGWRGEAVGKAI
jgi:hypothetical protein